MPLTFQLVCIIFKFLFTICSNIITRAGHRVCRNGYGLQGIKYALSRLKAIGPDRGSRPNLDAIVMLKSLFIQQLYNISDEQFDANWLIVSRLECSLAQPR
jgi:hypothetical protein